LLPAVVAVVAAAVVGVVVAPVAVADLEVEFDPDQVSAHTETEEEPWTSYLYQYTSLWPEAGGLAIGSEVVVDPDQPHFGQG